MLQLALVVVVAAAHAGPPVPSVPRLPETSGKPCACASAPLAATEVRIPDVPLGEEARPVLAKPATELASPLPPPLQELVERIENDPSAPQWKRTIAERIRTRQIGRFDAYLTAYCTDSSADSTGGGPRAAWDGIPLRWGHAASDWRFLPKGAVLFIGPPVDAILIVVDNGPGVRGAGRLDICTTESGHYRSLSRQISASRPVACWRLGRKVTPAEAR